MEKRRYALRLAYAGHAFRGFARQSGLPTVEGALASALAEIGLHTRLDVAARTDAGVHAFDQVVSFWAHADLDPVELRAAVNRLTPPELVCLEARRVAPSFHARASALTRRYVYLVGTPPPPTLARYAWTLPDARAFPQLAPAAYRLDVGAMRTALAAALGTHDFTGLARPGIHTQNRARSPDATVRTLLCADVIAAEGAPLVFLVFEANGFVRAMVRHLAGAAVTVGLGLAPPSLMSELLQRRTPYRGVRAPGWGLTLVKVCYPEGTWGAGPRPTR